MFDFVVASEGDSPPIPNLILTSDDTATTEIPSSVVGGDHSKSPYNPYSGDGGGGMLLTDSGDFELPNFSPGDEVPEMISFPCEEDAERPPAPSADDYPLGCVAGLVDFQRAVDCQTEELWDPSHDLVWSMPGRKEVTVVRHTGEYTLVKASVNEGTMIVQATVYRACLKEPKVKFKKYLDLNMEEGIDIGAGSNNSSNGNTLGSNNNSNNNGRGSSAAPSTGGSNSLALNIFSPEAARQYRKATSSGNRAFKAKQFSLCIESYTEAIGLSGIPKSELCRAMVNRSAGFLAKGDKEGALEDALACLRLDPRDVSGYARAGNVYRTMKNYKKAEEYYLHALKLSPNNNDLRLILDSNSACAHFKTLGHNSLEIQMQARDKFAICVKQSYGSFRTIWTESPQLAVAWPESGQSSARGDDKCCSHCLKILNEREVAMEVVAKTDAAKEFVSKHYAEVPTNAGVNATPTMSLQNSVSAAHNHSVSGWGGSMLGASMSLMNQSHTVMTTSTPIVSCARGCGATFCSQTCHDQSWEEYHQVECPSEGAWAKGMTKLNHYLKNAPFAASTIALLFLTIRFLSKMIVSRKPEETIKEVSQKTIYLPVASAADRGRDEALESMVLTPCFELLCQGLSTENGEATAINFLVFRRIFFQMKTAAIGFRVSNWPNFYSRVENHLDLMNSGLGVTSGQSSARSLRGGPSPPNTNGGGPIPISAAEEREAQVAAIKQKEGLLELVAHQGLYNKCVGVFPVASCCGRGEYTGSNPLVWSLAGVPQPPVDGSNVPRKQPANVAFRCPPNALGAIPLKSLGPIPKKGLAVVKTCYDL